MSFSDLLDIDFTSKIENNSKIEPAENEVFSLGTMLVETEEQDIGSMSPGKKEQDSTFNNDLNVKRSLLVKTLENSKLNSNASNVIPSTFNTSMKTKNQLLKRTLLNVQLLTDLNTQATASNDPVDGDNLLADQRHANPTSKPFTDQDAIAQNDIAEIDAIESVNSTFNNDLNVKRSLLVKTLENSKLNSNASNVIPSTFNTSMKTKNQLLKRTLLNAQLLTDSTGVANLENNDGKSLFVESDNMSSSSVEIPSKNSNYDHESKENLTIENATNDNLMTDTANNDADPNQNASLEAPGTHEDNQLSQLSELELAYEMVNQTSTFADFENASFAESTHDIISTNDFGDFSDFDYDKTPTPSVTDFSYFPNSLDHPVAPPSSPVDASDTFLSRSPLERNDSSTILNDLETDHFPNDPAIKEDQVDFSMHPSTNYVELDFIESEDLLRKKDENSWWWKFPCL